MKTFHKIGRDARVDWVVVLSLSAATAIALAIGGLSLYNAVVKGDIQGKPKNGTSASSKFNEKSISGVIGDFDKRVEMSNEARAGHAGVGDPSI
jgi:hypothetical protein